VTTGEIERLLAATEARGRRLPGPVATPEQIAEAYAGCGTWTGAAGLLNRRELRTAKGFTFCAATVRAAVLKHRGAGT
jgi:hypothetical protein